jgi:ubiquinone/menaquinone biosynthesis C-methylase UbiE
LEPPQFKDLFSKQSKEYAISRPTYPRMLFEFLVSLVHHRKLAWDCGTGNGQAALFLSEYFEQVIASDASKEQIENAQPRNNIRYELFPAEKTNLEDNSIDLLTVAQALHWFDLENFYREVRRVMRKDAKASGVIAAWAYGLHSINPDIDKVIHWLYEDILGSYWPKERKYIENRYRDIPFPFHHVSAPHFQIELDWNLSELVSYLYTWSSVQKFIEKNNSDPVNEIYENLIAAWGGEAQIQDKRKVIWPIYMKVGRLD